MRAGSLVGVLVVAMACLLSLSAQNQTASDLDAGSKIRTLETMWNRAELKGDVQALDLIFDISMIYIDEDGAMLTKAQFLNRVAKEGGSELQWLVTPTMNVNVYDDTAVVVGSYRVIGVLKGKPYERTGRFIDTWAFKNGAWLCVVAQATPILR
jgi:hypothetical protein